MIPMHVFASEQSKTFSHNEHKSFWEGQLSLEKYFGLPSWPPSSNEFKFRQVFH
jgi:hypothetical protein